MSLQQTGIIHKIFDQEQITDTFKKRLIILVLESGAYTEYPAFEFVQDRCDMLSQYKEGETVTIHFDLKGRDHNGKFYTNLRGWKIATDGEGSHTGIVKVAEVPEKKDDGGEGLDGLPF